MSGANSYPLNNRGGHNEFGAIHEEVLNPNGMSHMNHNDVAQHPSSTPLGNSPSNRPLLDFGAPKRELSNFKPKVYYPYFTYLISLLTVAVFAFQLYNTKQLTGSFIQTQPLNFLLGPPVEVLINQGGLFTPCMKQIQIGNENFRCPADSNQNPGGSIEFVNSQPRTCTLEQVCGLNGFKSGVPDQWYRFIVPAFLHGGVLHLFFNVLTLLALGVQLERIYGPIRIAIIYLAAGFGGFLLGGNLASSQLTSVGASGAIFGLIASNLVDLVINWNRVIGPWCELFKVMVGIIITLALGLIPIVDNFSHIGGFVAGLLASGLTMPSCRVGKRTHTFGFLIFLSLISGVLLSLGFYFAINGFYYGDWAKSCPQCKYLNCLPIGNLCESSRFS